MSYYTYVSPDISKFGYIEMDNEMLNNEIKNLDDNWEKYKAYSESITQRITALAFVTPKFEDFDNIVREAQDLINDYIKYCVKLWDLHMRYEIIDDIIYHREYISKDPYKNWKDFGEGKNEYGETHDEFVKRIDKEIENWKPSVGWNHWGSDTPDYEIRDANNSINSATKKIIAYAVATPKDIVTDPDADIIYYIANDLDSIFEWIEDCVKRREFAKLLDEFPETISNK